VAVRVAVCCPGPSLPARWPGRAGYDAVYAVNRALRVIDADWLAAGDSVLYEGDLLGAYRPRLGCVTMAEVAERFAADPSWAGLRWARWQDLALVAVHADRGRPMMWSVQLALCHAAESGAAAIDLIGADGAASGTIIDCTGHAGEARGPDRWAREARDLDLTIALLAERGIAITRFAP
jgi:hypothetical protein